MVHKVKYSKVLDLGSKVRDREGGGKDVRTGDWLLTNNIIRRCDNTVILDYFKLRNIK